MMPCPAVLCAGVKGGVGKTSLALNLALELAQRVDVVGFLDADVDSPFAAEVLRIQERIGLDEERRMVPVTAQGLRVMSFAAWLPNGTMGTTMPGEMHRQWLKDALSYTEWGPLDVLVVDLPAGSSDEWLIVREVLGSRVLGVVAVAEPGLASALQRVWDAATWHHVPVLGVVENKAGEVYGQGKVEAWCKQRGARFLGSVPLDKRIRMNHEAGEPRFPGDLMGPIRGAADAVVDAMGVAVRLSPS